LAGSSSTPAPSIPISPAASRAVPVPASGAAALGDLSGRHGSRQSGVPPKLTRSEEGAGTEPDSIGHRDVAFALAVRGNAPPDGIVQHCYEGVVDKGAGAVRAEEVDRERQQIEQTRQELGFDGDRGPVSVKRCSVGREHHLHADDAWPASEIRQMKQGCCAKAQ
jgi:hypothetical protein